MEILEARVDESTAEIQKARDELKERADLLGKRAKELEVAYTQREQVQEQLINSERRLK